MIEWLPAIVIDKRELQILTPARPLTEGSQQAWLIDQLRSPSVQTEEREIQKEQPLRPFHPEELRSNSEKTELTDLKQTEIRVAMYLKLVRQTELVLTTGFSIVREPIPVRDHKIREDKVATLTEEIKTEPTREPLLILTGTETIQVLLHPTSIPGVIKEIPVPRQI
ncbi:MAG: hypothetical protein EA411_06430 [Saprospirales bacterium]|nr:MAG: hypothetical protein EA411_06430 [Saprospirales bacterium]